MPWCEGCSRFYTPSTLTRSGDCPSGHHVADAGDAPPLVQSSAPGRDETGVRAGAAVDERSDRVRAPWHFWVLVAAVSVYLGWRLVQGIILLF